jgi:hypothetical protein
METTSISASIVIGVVSSLIFWIALEVGKAYWQSVILPWYQTKVYDGCVIAGRWRGVQDRGDRGKFVFEVELRQTGHRLHGTLTTIDEYKDVRKHRHRTFPLVGSSVDGYVLLTYSGSQTRNLGLGALLFQIRDAGAELSGSVLFLKTSQCAIGVDDDLTIYRQDANNDKLG